MASKDITPTELKQRLETKEDLNFLDVREEWEYEENNLGAKNIPLGQLPAHLKELEDWKNEEVIIHCKSGKRSANAQKFLQQQGFKHVRNLEGGIEAMS